MCLCVCVCCGGRSGQWFAHSGWMSEGQNSAFGVSEKKATDLRYQARIKGTGICFFNFLCVDANGGAQLGSVRGSKGLYYCWLHQPQHSPQDDTVLGTKGHLLDGWTVSATSFLYSASLINKLGLAPEGFPAFRCITRSNNPPLFVD